MINVDDELLRIDNEYSETEIFLKYGVVSLMFYEPTPYTKLIVAINNERDKYGLSTLFQTNFFRLFFRYCTGV